jgi:hypothetical protein
MWRFVVEVKHFWPCLYRDSLQNLLPEFQSSRVSALEALKKLDF